MIGSTLKAWLLVAAVVASDSNLPLLGLELGLLLVGLHLDIVETLELLLEFVLPLIVLLLQRYLSVLPDRLPLVLILPELTLRLSYMFDQATAANPLLHAPADLSAIYLRKF